MAAASLVAAGPIAETRPEAVGIAAKGKLAGQLAKGVIRYVLAHVSAGKDVVSHPRGPWPLPTLRGPEWIVAQRGRGSASCAQQVSWDNMAQSQGGWAPKQRCELW